MAKFKTAYDRTMGHEGGYANDVRDRGGETYRGIARNFHPSWRGWKIIDEAKSDKSNFPEMLRSEKFNLLHEMVESFYKRRYWDVYSGDYIESQLIANELFDTGVNMGTQRAVLFLQKSLNILIYKKGVVAVDPLVEDGLFGKKTFTALESMKAGYTKVLYNLINLMQGNHYLRYIEKDPRQSAFLIGWLNRVEIQK